MIITTTMFCDLLNTSVYDRWFSLPIPTHPSCSRANLKWQQSLWLVTKIWWKWVISVVQSSSQFMVCSWEELQFHWTWVHSHKKGCMCWWRLGLKLNLLVGWGPRGAAVCTWCQTSPTPHFPPNRMRHRFCVSSSLLWLMCTDVK